MDGVNQYGPGAQYAYVETDSDTVTFVSGLHVGALVKFTTATLVSPNATDAENVSYTAPFTGSVVSNVENKLAESVSVKDFGAVGDGIANEISAFQDALDYINSIGGGTILVPPGDYLFKYNGAQPVLTVYSNTDIYIQKGAALLSQAIFGGFNSGLFTNDTGATNISIRGQGKFKAATGISLAGVLNNTTTISGLSSTAGLYVNMPVSGNNIPAGAYVVSVSSTSVVISSAATTSATQTVTFHYTGTPFVAMIGVDGFYMGQGLSMMDVYGASVGFAYKTELSVQNFVIDGIFSNYEDRSLVGGAKFAGEDFLHFYGGTSNGTVSNCAGYSGDDFIAFNLEPTGAVVWDTPMSNINVVNCSGVSLWSQMLRIYINPTSTVGSISYINVSNLTGTSNDLGGNSGSCGAIIEDTSSRNAIANINITNFAANCQNNGADGIFVSYADDVTVDNFEPFEPDDYSIRVENSARFTANNPKITTANRNVGGVPGIYIVDSSDATVNGGTVNNATSHGVQYDNVTRGFVNNVTFINNDGNGIAVTGTSEHLRLTGNYFNGNSGPAIQEYNTVNHNLISANDVTDNSNGSFTVLGTNTVVVFDNIGYTLPNSGITVTASPFTYTAGNTFETIYIQGGTVSSINVNGTQVFVSTDKTIRLGPQQSVVVTYTVAPSMTKIFN